MEEWYAVQTKPRKEFLASRALAAIAGVRTYLPCLHVKPINPRSRKTLPFFSGYLFLLADLARVGLSTVRWTPGVMRVLGCGDTPVSIPSSVIDQIRHRVAVLQQEDPAGLGHFRQGDRVRITTGLFEGFEGMFDTRLSGRMRARILVDFVGRLTPTEVDIRYLEKASPRTV
jgi:transcription elongation factor/antiterminator RfaH